MKYSIVTFGCRVNQADSFQIEEQLIAAGGTAAATHDADLVVVNTCSVTGAADQGTRQIVRKIARENPARQNRRHRLLRDAAARRSRRVCPASFRSFPTIARISSRRKSGLTHGASGSATATARAARRSRRDWPAARRLRCACRPAAIRPAPTASSRRRADAGRSTAARTTCSRRSTACRRAGYREIAITGVHLGSYGRDLARRLDASGSAEGDRRARAGIALPHQLARADGLHGRDRRSGGGLVVLRAAFSSSAAARERSHAGGDAAAVHAGVLPPAGRSHPRATCRTRRSAPTSSSGFLARPTKTSRRSRSYLARSPLTHVHVFPYSDRPGTAAAALPDKVHGSIVRERASALRAIGRELNQRFHRSAGRRGAPGADHRGWVARGDRQLSEGENSARARAGTNG